MFPEITQGRVKTEEEKRLNTCKAPIRYTSWSATTTPVSLHQKYDVFIQFFLDAWKGIVISSWHLLFLSFQTAPLYMILSSTLPPLLIQQLTKCAVCSGIIHLVYNIGFQNGDVCVFEPNQMKVQFSLHQSVIRKKSYSFYVLSNFSLGLIIFLTCSWYNLVSGFFFLFCFLHLSSLYLLFK